VSSSDGRLRLLEELFPRSRKALRVLGLFVQGGEYTRYAVEKEAAVSHVSELLERLVALGVLEKTGDDPPVYRLSRDSRYRELLEKIFLE